MKAWNRGNIKWNQCLKCAKDIRQWLKYCSHACYIQNRPKPVFINKICITCNKNFKVRLSEKTHKNCSDACGSIAAGKSNSGTNHPMYGTTLSQAHREKLRIANMGRRPWNYRGVTSRNRLERQKFRVIMQKSVFKRDNYQCLLCGNKNNLQVDHIKPWAKFPEERFNMKNCRTLCAKCHYQITFNKPMPDSIRGWGHNLMKGGTQNFC